MNRRNFIVSGLAGLAWVALRAHGTLPGEKTRVTGVVRDASTARPLAGVAVSNGYRIVLTDARGGYEIDLVPGDYPFVFVNAPSGYEPAGASFLRLPEGAEGGSTVNFALAPAPHRTGSRLRLAHVSDSHIGVERLPHFASDRDLAADYEAILAEAAPDLLINTGDVTDAGRVIDFEAVQVLTAAVSAKAGRPIFTVFGNHDADEDRARVKGVNDRANNLSFQAVMGPDQYTFDWGDYHFIVSGFFWPGESFRRPRMEAWLAADLALQPPHKRIILLTHDKPRVFPLVEPCYAPPLPQLAKHPGSILALHGHHHTTCVLRYGPITVVGVPTVCVGGIDTSPRGYAVIDVDGPDVRVELRPLTKSGYRLAVPRGPAALPTGGAPELACASKVKWVASLGTTLHRAAPVVAGKNAIYSLGDHRPGDRCGLTALDLERGTVAWECRTEAAIKNSIGTGAAPEEADSGFAAEVTGRLYRLDLASGRVTWRQELRNFPDRYIYATPVVASRGIYVLQSQGMSAHDPRSGRVLWERGAAWDENRSAVYQRPVADETKVFCLKTNFLGEYSLGAFNRDDGRPIWTRRFDQMPAEYPAKLYQSHYPSPVLAGGYVVLAGLADRVLVLDRAEGRTVWDLPALRREGPQSGAHPAFYHVVQEHAAALLVAGETIFATTSNGGVVALDLATGARRWEFSTPRPPLLDFQPYFRGQGNIISPPALVNGQIVVGGADGYLYLLDARSGRLVQAVNFGAPITAAPVQAGPTLLISCFDGRAFCYQVS